VSGVGDFNWRWHRFLVKCGLATTPRTNELMYQTLFAWCCERNGLEKRFHPLRSAANHSLLYLLGRILEENPVKRIVELGAGQTTLLLDGLAPKTGAQVLTLESDAFWGSEIQAKVKHEVRTSPLLEREVRGHRALGFDLSSLTPQDKFDLVVVDGPLGRDTQSRWGCLALLERHLADEFIVVFDDAERPGELETVAEARKLLRERVGTLHEVQVVALKRQVAFASSAYQRVAWY